MDLTKTLLATMWQHLPPYLYATVGPQMIKASCLCGEVTFQIDGAVSMTRYCHCTNCRKFSGTAQAAWGVARVDQFSQTSGNDSVGGLDAIEPRLGGDCRRVTPAPHSPLAEHI